MNVFDILEEDLHSDFRNLCNERKIEPDSFIVEISESIDRNGNFTKYKLTINNISKPYRTISIPKTLV